MSQASTSGETKEAPKTARGKRTLRRLLDAAEQEFGVRGFHDTGITHITQRAGVALGTFYVYFSSKEEVFRALVADMGAVTRHALTEAVKGARDRIEAERLGLEAYIRFVRAHKGLYRIIMEAQFVAPEAYREYYRAFAAAYVQQLAHAADRGEISPGDNDVRVWALMGLSTFIGLRYGVWDDDADAAHAAAAAADLVSNGLTPRPRKDAG